MLRRVGYLLAAVVVAYALFGWALVQPLLARLQ